MDIPEAVRRDLEAIAELKRYYAWKSALLSPHLGRRVVEVGCGNGLMLEQLGDRELLAGAEPDGFLAGEAKRRLGGRAEVRQVDVMAPEFLSFAEARPDTVLFVNVLEMVPDDRAALRQARSILVPEGKVVVLASALPSLQGELDRSFGQRRYGRGEFHRLLESEGFRVSSLRYANLLGALGWWLDSKVMKRREMTAVDYRRRDRMVPFARLLDALTGPPIGRLLLGVGIKT